MFGLGWAELVVIAMIAMLFIFFAVILPLLRTSSSAPRRRRDELDEMRAEIVDLRDEVERLKNGSEKNDSSSGVTADRPK